MNPPTILRIFNRSKRAICVKTICQRVPQQTFYKMSTNTSISEIYKEKEIFMDVLPGIIDTVVKRSKLSDEPEVAVWMKKVLEYNLHGGKKARGLATTFAYETLSNPEDITEELLNISRILGWCVEMIHAYFLVVDDIMDGSTKRRGAPCWYRLPDVGLGAINDSILIQASIFEILKMNCGHLPQYSQIMECFTESLLFTSMGQYLDFSMAHRNKDDYSLFTEERYSSIVRYKTGYYTYKLPVCLGMLLVNITDHNIHKKAEEICLMIGHLFQIQDDFIDCYGMEHKTGKLGTDIQERKCSWLAVQALKHCNQSQRKVFVTCYGSSEPAHIERIKRLYDELNIPALYENEEKKRYDEVIRCVEQLPENTLSRDLFIKLLNEINQRKV